MLAKITLAINSFLTIRDPLSWDLSRRVATSFAFAVAVMTASVTLFSSPSVETRSDSLDMTFGWIFGRVVAAPFLENFFLFMLMKVIRIDVRWSILCASLAVASIHGFFDPITFGVYAVAPFWIIGSTYYAYLRRGFGCAVLMAFFVHASHNLLSVLWILCSGWL